MQVSIDNANGSRIVRYSKNIVHWVFVGLMQLLGWSVTAVIVHLLIDHVGPGTGIGNDDKIDYGFYVAIDRAGQTEAIRFQEYQREVNLLRAKLWRPGDPLNIKDSGDFTVTTENGAVTLEMQPNDFPTLSIYRIVDGEVKPTGYRQPSVNLGLTLVLSFLLFFTFGQWLMKRLCSKISQSTGLSRPLKN